MLKRNKTNVVRMEKKATNKIGLFFVILLAVGGFGYGGFYLFQHRKEIDWELKLPWSKEKDEEDNEKTDSKKDNGGSKNAGLDGRLVVPSLNEKEFGENQGKLKLYNIRTDSKGYYIDVDFKTSAPSSTLTIFKVLVDGYDTSVTLRITDIADDEATTSTILIPKTELDALKIVSFNKLDIYYKIDTPEKEGVLSRREIQAYNKIEYDNTLKGLIEFYNANEVKGNFYKVTDDKENTYIYFYFINENRNAPKNVKIRRLLINGELFEYKDFNLDIYCGTNKVFYLTIPKKKVKKVENFTISFSILGLDLDGEIKSFTFTPDYEKKV